MSKVKVNVAVSIDGFFTALQQSFEHPMGIGGEALAECVFATRTWQRMHDQDRPQMPKDEGAHFGLTLLDWESAPSSFQSKIQVERDCRFWIGDSTPSASQSKIENGPVSYPRAANSGA
jgi:hypothetical protein